MKALLLAAGLGVRLKPVTDVIPKCLVPINGKPLLNYWLENLSAAGVNRFIINTSYLAEQVNEYISSSIYHDAVTLVYEEELLDTGGTLLANKALLNDAPFFLVHADNLSFCNFKDFIDNHYDRPNGCMMTMMLFKCSQPKQCGIVEIDNSGVVQKFFEKVQNPPSNMANGAVYICEPSIFKIMDELDKVKISFSDDVIPKLLGKIYTYKNDIYHRDIGNIEAYALSQIEIRDYFGMQ